MGGLFARERRDRAVLKVPNRLLEMGLSPNALKLYVFLLSCADAEKKAIVRVCRAAERCGCSAGTVRAGIKQLEQIGLVRKQNRYNQEGQYIANLYLLTPIAGRWSALDTENDIFTLSGSTFAVYLYLVCRKNGRGRAFPSLRKMAAAWCLACNTVIKAIRQLGTLGLILKAAIRKGKHNLYLVFSSAVLMTKEKELSRGNESSCTGEEKQSNNKFLNLTLPYAIISVKNRIPPIAVWYTATREGAPFL